MSFFALYRAPPSSPGGVRGSKGAQAKEAKRQLQLAHADKDALGRQLDIKQATLEAEVDMQHDLHRQGGELRSQLVRALGEGEALLKQLGGDAVALADIAEWREKVPLAGHWRPPQNRIP